MQDLIPSFSRIRKVMRFKYSLVLGLTFLLLTPADAALWQYEKSIDKLSDATIKTAHITSDSSLNFSFPYKGKNQATIYIRQRSDAAEDVIFTIDRGQIICNDCYIRVRFDNDALENFEASKSTDHDPRIAFLRPARTFVQKAQSAKRIRVEFTAFQQGVNIVDFKAEKTLNWILSTEASAPISSQIIVADYLAERQKDIDESKARRTRLDALVANCHQTKERFAGCISAVRQCYQTISKDNPEEVCEKAVTEYPKKGVPNSP